MKSINNLENKASSKKRTSFIKIFTFICFSFLSLTLVFGGLNFKTKNVEYSSAETLRFNDYGSCSVLDKISFTNNSKSFSISISLSDFFVYSGLDSSYTLIPMGYNVSLTYGSGSSKTLSGAFSSVYIDVYPCGRYRFNITPSGNFYFYLSGAGYDLNITDITIFYSYISGELVLNPDYDTAFSNGYNSGYWDGHSSGYTAGQNSVDITTDNNQAIQDYIANNNYHTDTEYNQYGENQYNSGYTAGQNSVDITTDNNQAIQDYITDNNYHTDTEYNQYGENQYNSGYTAGQNSVDITTDNQQAIDDFILSTAFECNESYDKFQLSTQVTSYSVTLPENLFELVSVNFTLISYYSSGGFLYNDTFDFSVNSFPYVVIGSKNAEYCKISLSDNVLLFDFITPTNTNGFFCYIDSLNVVYTCMGYTQEQYDLNYDNGYELGNSEGYSTGFDSGYDTGYSDGYVVGGNDELNGKNTFKDLIYSIIDAPFNVISSAFDFDIFGINIASFLMLIVSLLLVAFVLRRLL